MVDYYALPKEGDYAWPGRAVATGPTAAAKAQFVEREILENLADFLGGGFDRRRFVPFITIHEFEALLFSDCEAFSRAVARPELGVPLQEIRDQFENPEEIDDSPTTAPSKRIVTLIPSYEKPLFGTLAALEIGLHRIRTECPHFDSWIRHLERLAN